jgi:hypothetical protein
MVVSNDSNSSKNGSYNIYKLMEALLGEIDIHGQKVLSFVWLKFCPPFGTFQQTGFSSKPQLLCSCKG